MSKTLRFEGYSDDNFIYTVDGKGHGDYGYDNCAQERPIGFRVASSEGQMVVVGDYFQVPLGTWSVGVAQVDEDEPIPDWPVRFVNAHGYSVGLEIVVPDDATVTLEPWSRLS